MGFIQLISCFMLKVYPPSCLCLFSCSFLWTPVFFLHFSCFVRFHPASPVFLHMVLYVFWFVLSFEFFFDFFPLWLSFCLPFVTCILDFGLVTQPACLCVCVCFFDEMWHIFGWIFVGTFSMDFYVHWLSFGACLPLFLTPRAAHLLVLLFLSSPCPDFVLFQPPLSSCNTFRLNLLPDRVLSVVLNRSSVYLIPTNPSMHSHSFKESDEILSCCQFLP